MCIMLVGWLYWSFTFPLTGKVISKRDLGLKSLPKAVSQSLVFNASGCTTMYSVFHFYHIILDEINKASENGVRYMYYEPCITYCCSSRLLCCFVMMSLEVSNCSCSLESSFNWRSYS